VSENSRRSIIKRRRFQE